MKTLILFLLLGSFALVNAQTTPPQMPPCLKIVEEVDFWENPQQMAVDTCPTSPTFGDYFGYRGYMISIYNKKAVSIYIPRKDLDYTDTTWHVIDTSLSAIRSVLQHLEDSLGTIRASIWKGGDGDNDSIHRIALFFPTFVHAKTILAMFRNVYASGESGGWVFLPQRRVPAGITSEPVITDIEVRESPDKRFITIMLPVAYVPPSDVMIVNIRGDEVQRIHTANPTISADISSIPTGVYFVLWNGHTGRFIVGGKQ